MILLYLLIGLIGQANAGEPTKHLSTLLKHTQLQFKSLFGTTNTHQLLEEVSRHDIKCHKKPSFGSKAMLESNKKLLKRISQSDSDFKEARPGSSMLLNYVLWGLPERVLFLLKEGYNPNEVDQNKDTPIIWALEQYIKNEQTDPATVDPIKIEQKRNEQTDLAMVDPIKIEQKRKDFTMIIEDLLYHGSIIYGNSRYNCPFTYAQNNGLDGFLHLFKLEHERRIQKISIYYQQHGCNPRKADAISKKVISENVDLMSISPQERNVLIAQALYSQWMNK